MVSALELHFDIESVVQIWVGCQATALWTACDPGSIWTVAASLLDTGATVTWDVDVSPSNGVQLLVIGHLHHFCVHFPTIAHAGFVGADCDICALVKLSMDCKILVVEEAVDGWGMLVGEASGSVSALGFGC